jgi:hypothetical protein
MPTKVTKRDSNAEPDKLVRQQAGTYRTADERFEVREADTGAWFLVDSLNANEFGQELILGPFPTLKAVREALPDARKVTPMKRPRPKPAKRAAKEPSPPPPPPSWIDRLPAAEARVVRDMIRALEGDGVEDAESLVRRDREGLDPAIATRLIERELEALVADAPEKDRKRARELVGRAASVLTATRPKGGLPGWALIEVGPEPEPRNRRIVIGD